MEYNKALHRYAVFTAVCTFCLVIAGGLVTSTQSGLSVPDWPLSYGQVMPPMVGGILYEHGHRMVATFVGMLTIGLAVWLWRKERRRWMRVLGFVALGAVIAQGVLGGLTVLFLLPTPISVSHAALAQTFFALVSSIALFTSKWWMAESPEGTLDERSPSLGRQTDVGLVRLTFLTVCAVYVQLILGALMRHTHSGLAVPDFPLAYGQLFPSLSSEDMVRYNNQLMHSDIRIAADGPITSGQIIIHMLHRVWAVVVTLMVVWTALRLRGISRTAPHVARYAVAFLGLLLVQIALGALTVLTIKSVVITTAHVATGALLLAVSVLAMLQTVKITRWHFPRMGVLVSPREVTV